uniref:Apolipoprotein L3 n=1 Tax=Leptobrachium leishanense TaxID=445787 RepID=A0A8C5QTM0_9ANUR
MANLAERDRAKHDEETNRQYLDIKRRNRGVRPIAISAAEREPQVALEERAQDQEPNSISRFEYFRDTNSENEDEVEVEDRASNSLPERIRRAYSILEEQIRENIERFGNLQRQFVETVKECIKQLHSIADDVDKFHKGSIIASVAGSSFGIAGGIATIVGLCLAPVTFGASLIVTGVGIGVATAGGVTGAAASIADRFNIKAKCNKVEEIIKEINNMRENMQATLRQIDILIIEMIDLLGLNSDFVRVGVRGAYAAVEIARLVQLANLAANAARGAQIAARGAQAAAAVTGVFAALFIVVDTVFLFKAAMELIDGAKSEEAAKIRYIADQLAEDCNQMHIVESDFFLNQEHSFISSIQPDLSGT